MEQQKTFTQARFSDWPVEDQIHSAFLLGRAIPILEGLIESPTDAIDIQLARDLLADYRKWMERD